VLIVQYHAPSGQGKACELVRQLLPILLLMATGCASGHTRLARDLVIVDAPVVALTNARLIDGTGQAAAAIASASAWQNQSVEINVNDPRPLAMVEALERRYGWTVTYEDPAYLHASDLADLSYRVHKDDAPTKPRILGVRGGPFRFTYMIPSEAAEPQQRTLLDALLEQHHLSGNPGIFRVLRTGTVFHVVPSMRKGPDGVLEARGSILDAKISVADGERTVFDMFEEIVVAVNRSSGVKVMTGIVPMNLFMQARVAGGAQNESARTVILRTLESTKWKFSWQLLHDPTPPGMYALNVHVVPDRVRR
jgi:hypothetical protein